MSDVFGKIQAEDLRKIKVVEPSLAYAAKSTSREVIFALEIPYPLCKSWYEFVQDFSRRPEVERQTGSEKKEYEKALKYPYVVLLEQKIPEQHFCFSSVDDVRNEVNENLRKICSNVAQKYKASRGMARMKLNECVKKFHVLSGQTEAVKKMRDEIQKWKDECVNLEARCSELLVELQDALKESERKTNVIEDLQCTNQELSCYIETLEKSQGLLYQGKPLSDAKNKSRTIREFLKRANVALWFAKAFGIELTSFTIKETQTGQEHYITNCGEGTSTQAAETDETQNQYDRLLEEEKGKVQEVLFLLDKYCVGDNFYHELSMIANGIPKSYLIKQCRDRYDDLCHIEALPGNYQGSMCSFAELLTIHANDFLANNPNFDFANEPLKIKINGDGARMTRNSNFIFLTFSILQTGANVMSAKGNRNIAAVNASESYTTLKEAFAPTFQEINSFIDSGKLTINDKTINLEFFLGGDYKFILLMLGLKGATANYACAWCKIHKDDRWKTDKDFSYFNKEPMKRSLKELIELSKKSKENYCCEEKPLLKIELDHVVVDELHLMLRISDVLTKNIVYQAIDRDRHDDFQKKRGEDKGIHLKRLISTIRSLGITFDVWEQLNADKSSSGKYEFTSLTGSNKKILLSQLPDKLHDLLPAKSRDKIIKLWKNFNSLYSQINDMELSNSPESISNEAKEWIELFCSCRDLGDGYERARVTPYMHILFAHVPFFTQKYKAIKIFTGQGVEKNNDVARSVLHRKSNKWDSVGDILKQEFRQWELRDKEREKRKYVKKRTTYWEGDICSSRQKRRKTKTLSTEEPDSQVIRETARAGTADVIDPKTMTVKELKEKLKARGVKLFSNKNKSELIELLQNSLKE